MNKENGEFVGVQDLHYALVTVDTENQYVTETPAYLAPAAEVTNEAEISTKNTYYDNKPADTYITEGATTVNMTVSGVPAKLAAKLSGKYYDATTGRVYDSGSPEPPDCALGFVFNKGKRDARHYWYLKGTFSLGTEEAASKSNDVDIKTYQMTYTGVTTEHEWQIDGKMQSLKRVFADTTDPAFNSNGWFQQVQTPDTAASPNELTVSSLPADNTTGVAVGASIVLTFNNRVASYQAVIVKSDFTAVATTNSFDSTGKILTINPTADLSASSSYAVILTNVKDVYGQTIDNTVINFTTA